MSEKVLQHGDLRSDGRAEGLLAVGVRLDGVELLEDRVEIALVASEPDHAWKNASFIAPGNWSEPSNRNVSAFCRISADLREVSSG